jgi:hypothetical protein
MFILTIDTDNGSTGEGFEFAVDAAIAAELALINGALAVTITFDPLP